ncbi:putative metal-dependent hydrolase [Haploplasma axanthum]|uniref:Endoribonuclease YbeY n=2 Tax=Haploplasma axanthum TaxID=29552 RepID=A0A449BF04_HAPAX|nr:rRNA maturation RNase YbeY [Haploplasma axanthum]VEU81005.1 putative metal-dependent hydrolase [Haploplasma axanthum]
MIMEINFYNQTELETKEYEAIIKNALKNQKNEKSMEIVFVTPNQIHEMNKTYRDVDRPTDVLSFPNDDDKDTSIGDIFINLEQAFSQASEYGHRIEREVAFLAVHGYLHLLGYDHYTPEEEKEMFDLQEKILLEAGIERK